MLSKENQKENVEKSISTKKYTDIGRCVRLKEYPWIPKYQYQVGIILDTTNEFRSKLYTIYLFKLKEKVDASIYEFDFVRVKK